ncbi:MAG: CDP-diacylglycerol--glycerol-3-phosphate 3-phosphatidyltransferase [Spirochaetota bacterium]
MAKNRWFMYHISNVLTILRVVVVPFFIMAALGEGAASGWAALVLFGFAALSDYFDGLCARRLGIHTRFGEFADPLADKILVGAAFISFALMPVVRVAFWIVAVILLREIFVTLMRIVGLNRNKPMKTEYSGKIKTAFQMFTISIILIILLVYKINLPAGPMSGYEQGMSFWSSVSGNTLAVVMVNLPLVLVCVSAVLAFFSMVQYTLKNRHLFSSRKQ